MDADFAVELGGDDAALEFPWDSAETQQRYQDLKHHPELLPQVLEAREYAELGSFLMTVNGRSAFLTAKCDVWTDTELSPAEEIYGAGLKLAFYVDLLFEFEDARFSFAEHERIAVRLCSLLAKAPEIPGAVELIIRRCYYRQSKDESRDGFYFTVYVYGYGDDEGEARQRWGIAINLLQNALLQLTAEIRGAGARK